MNRLIVINENNESTDVILTIERPNNNASTMYFKKSDIKELFDIIDDKKEFISKCECNNSMKLILSHLNLYFCNKCGSYYQLTKIKKKEAEESVKDYYSDEFELITKIEHKFNKN